MGHYKELAMQNDLRRPIVRNSDRGSSHAAAQHMQDSGKLGAQLQHVLTLVLAHPHCTAFELTDFSDLDRYQIQRRLSDLSELGKVKASEQGRRCFKSGRSACTWSVT
jgi:hypothetical protein